jgi:dihydrofolate synthase/folylpolyglutamate synthase
VDPLAFLFSLERLGMKFGLEHISRLCDALDHPERAFQSILIAGTNGKGSVTAMTETALTASGRRAARYTSPHLARLEERFVIGGREVETRELLAALARVQEVSTALASRGVIDSLPTFFEGATAAAFELFRRAHVEIAVLEVGLGGRLDATNVVTPIAAAITSIDFDHQAQLGNTLESIAREKAGVIKPGVPVVCGPLPAEAERIIRERAAECGAPYVDGHRTVHATLHDDGTVTLTTDDRALNRVRLALRGRHQIANAAVVVSLLDALRRQGVDVDDEAARAGLRDVRWPGRLEHVRGDGAEILLDAAHNPAGAAALASYLREIGWTDAVLIFGAMQDKDVAAMLAELAPLSTRIVCTTAPNPRAMPAAALAGIAREIARCPVEAVDPPEAAVARARAAGRRIVAAGSIFLIGPLRGILR